MNHQRLIPAVFGVTSVVLLFAVEFPLGVGGGGYASMNSTDIAIAIVFLLCVSVLAEEGWNLQLVCPKLTAITILLTGWIVLSLFVAAVRFEQSVFLSVLWLFKWFVVVVAFVVFQHLMTARAAAVTERTLIAGCLVLAGIAIALSLVGAQRVRVFFGNPNSLAAMFLFPVAYGLTKAVVADSLTRMAKFFALCMAGVVGLLTTASRSGLIGLVVVVAFISLRLRKRITRRQLTVASGVTVVALFALPVVLNPNDVQRLTEWIVIQNGMIDLSSSQAAASFRSRIRLTQQALAMAQSYPLIGYGWFATPTRVGYLDTYYTTILVDIGVVGLLLMLLFHASIVGAFLARGPGRNVALGTAGAAWHVGLLAQGVGGAFPRSPQLLLLTVLLLVAARVSRTVDDRPAASVN